MIILILIERIHYLIFPYIILVSFSHHTHW